MTAWLRVPLDWFHSTTYAQFPDETHGSIRKTFQSAAASTDPTVTRRQFCGYCGTHLTAWNEGTSEHSGLIDVTLGSLRGESLERLEDLGFASDSGDEEGEREAGEDESVGGAEAMQGPSSKVLLHRMHHRGMPYFEERVENSRLGRIRRRTGRTVSNDGRTTVEWEVTEIDSNVERPPGEVHTRADTSTPSKRAKLDQ